MTIQLYEFTPDELSVINIVRHYKSFSEAITQYEISDLLSSPAHKISPRQVRRIIDRLVAKGQPVISTPDQVNHGHGGYCWEGAPGEALKCYHRLIRKGIKTIHRAGNVLNNYNNGQMELNI